MLITSTRGAILKIMLCLNSSPWVLPMRYSLLAASTLASVTLFSVSAQAGVWNDGNWGRMYWGANAESAPTAAPTVNAQADGTDITFALTNLLNGADNGWSAITGFKVTCGGGATVLVSAANPTLRDLEPGTQYDCSIIAVNDNGESAPGYFSVETDAMGGLPIWLLYQATQSQAG